MAGLPRYCKAYFTMLYRISVRTTPQKTVHPSESRKYFILDSSTWKHGTRRYWHVF
jgi:hypothetical protein